MVAAQKNTPLLLEGVQRCSNEENDEPVEISEVLLFFDGISRITAPLSLLIGPALTQAR